MTLDFPSSPSDGQVYSAPNGVSYVYDFTNGYWIVEPEDVDKVEQIIAGSNVNISPVEGKGIVTINTQSDVPVGSVITFAGATVPTGWLECNGQAAPSALASVLGTSNVPDLRGEFVRGFDSGRGVDSGRSLLSLQDWQYSEHNHNVIDPGHAHPIPDLSSSGSVWPCTIAGGSSLTLTNINSGSVGTGITISSEGGTQNGGETRPRNVALMYIIKT